jgi:hypothetical protein
MPRKKQAAEAAEPSRFELPPIAVNRQGQMLVPEGGSAAVAMAFETLKTALIEAHASGRLAETATPEHIATLMPVLTDHPDVAHALFEAGFLSALQMMQQVAQLVSSVADVECGIPGHDHGPVSGRQVGRA